jgi:2-methylcitrate dehydratase PrpD
VQDWLAIRVADTVGLIGGALESQPAAAVLDVARSTAGAAPLLFTDATVMPSYAALSHGTLAHIYDYDDTYPESVVHPSSVVLPAALAAGHAADGETVAVAMLAGYEFLARAGAAAGRRLHARGFQATGVLGPLGAALVASLSTGVDERSTVWAMGLSGSMSGSLLEFLSDGTWSKRMHPGWAAHAGINAVELARRGFTGPATILEGDNGLFRAFTEVLPENLDSHFDDLGDRWACLSLQTKLFPCAHVIHPYLEVLLDWIAAPGNDAADIASITCRVAPWAVPIVAEPLARKRSPATEYEARTSLPFALALAVVDGVIAASSFADAALTDAAVLDAAARVSYVEDPTLERDFPAKLLIQTTVGGSVELSSRAAQTADDASRIREKFEANLRDVGGAGGRQRIWDAAVGFARTSPSELASACLDAVS